MKKILSIIICLCIVVSFSACQDTNNTVHNGSGVSNMTDEENSDSFVEDQDEVNVKYGTYILTDMYIVSNGIHVDMEYIQTQYVYLGNDSLLWYVLSGVLWTCRNYDNSIVGNKICCIPIYNEGLVQIEFIYDEGKNEIIYEANDVRSVFSYYSDDKPIRDDDVYQNV